MINNIKLQKRLEFAISKSKNMSDEEGSKYLSKSMVDLFTAALKEVKIVIPKNKVIVENENGRFEKSVSAIEGYLDL